MTLLELVIQDLFLHFSKTDILPPSFPSEELTGDIVSPV